MSYNKNDQNSVESLFQAFKLCILLGRWATRDNFAWQVTLLSNIGRFL